MARGRGLPKLELSEAEREQLQAWARGSKTSQALALRSRIVLTCAEAQSNHEVARRFQVTPQTVGKWRSRFLEKRLAGLTDEPRPGAPRKLTDAAVAVLLTTALSGTAPPGGSRCTSRALAARLGVSQSTVSRVLRAMGAQPQAPDIQRLSHEPHYIDQVRDIVGLYIDGPLRAIVLCVDEKRPPQPPATAVRWPPAGTVLPARHALDYPRYGDTTLFEALDRAICGLGGSARGAGSEPFRAFLHEVDAAVPAERVLHVVIDDKGRPKRPNLERWFARKPRFRLLVAPSCDAWIEQVERWFALLVQRQARTGHDGSAAALEEAIRAFLATAGSAPFSWVKYPPRHPEPAPAAPGS